jgi:isopropylmalate/homocitrate/citramalate synthase
MNREKVQIFDTTKRWRTGSWMQIRYQTKLVIANRLDEMGVDIEASCFKPGDFVCF